jgi:hypothetical protein
MVIVIAAIYRKTKQKGSSRDHTDGFMRTVYKDPITAIVFYHPSIACLKAALLFVFSLYFILFVTPMGNAGQNRA